MIADEEAIENADITADATGDDEPGSDASIARSTALMTVATLGSRATGLIRTWAMAFALGNGLITSAYQVANNMPNVIYELVAGGLLAAAFLPVYLSQKERFGTEGGNKFANNLLNLAIIALGILSILATIFAPQVIATQTFTVSDTAEVTVYAIRFFRIFALQIVFYGIGGILTGLLNANRVYFLPSVAPALNNIIVIVCMFAYVPLSQVNHDTAIIMLAVGTTLGVAVQFLIQIPALIKQGFVYKPVIDLHDPALIEAVKIAAPTFIYIIGTMIAYSCRNAFSLQAGDNGPSTLIYAWTWYQLPYGVVAVSLSRALFTEMSEAVAKNDWDKMRRHTTSGIANTLLLIIPMAGIMCALAMPLMQLFRAGSFSADDVRTVASILAIWVISLPVYSIMMLLYNVFASIRKFLMFAIVSTIMVVVQCLMYAVLCRPEFLGLVGVPIADLVYYGVCCVILCVLLRKYIGAFKLAEIASSSVRVLIATVIGSVAVYFLNGILPSDLGIALTVVRLCVCGLIGLLIIFGLCSLMKVPGMAVVNRLVSRVTGKLKH